MSKFQPFPLPDGQYSDQARSFVAQDVVNLIRVNAEQPGTRNSYQLKSVPGLRPFSTLADVSRQRGGYVVEGRLLVVMDQSLLQVATDGTLSVLGTIPGNGRVSFSHNQITNGNEVLITNGTQGFVWNTVAETLTQVTDEGFMGGLLSKFIGSRFLTLDPARRFFQNGELADGLAWNSSEFYAGESSPDRIRAVEVVNNEVVLLSETSIEHFAYTGTTNELFSNKGIALGRGCASTHAVSVMDNALFFIGNDGGGYEKRGYELRRITTHAIEQAWSKCTWHKSFSFTWEDKGHKVWYVTFPDGHTWGYDLATRVWHRRSSYGMDRWRLAWCVQWNGDWYGGEYNGGRIFKLDWAYPLEGADPLSREFAPGVLSNNGNRMQLHALRLNVEVGPDVEADDAESVVVVPTSTFEDLMEASNPIAWWKLQDAGATAVEEIAGYNGTYGGNVTPNDRALRQGGMPAAYFDAGAFGASGRVEVPVPSAGAIDFDTTREFSMAGWYRADDLGSLGGIGARLWWASNDPLTGKTNAALQLVSVGGGSYRESGVFSENTGVGAGVSRSAQSPTPAEADATHFLVWTYDPDVADAPLMKLYQDGVEIATSNPTVTHAAFWAVRMRIAGDATYGGSVQFVGWLSDIALWRHALSPAEILGLWNAGHL